MIPAYTKQAFRNSLIDKRNKISQQSIQKASHQICKIINTFLISKQSETDDQIKVAIYWPIQNEIDVRESIAKFCNNPHFEIYLPRWVPQCPEEQRNLTRLTSESILSLKQPEYVLTQIQSIETDLIPGKYGILEPKLHLPTLLMADAKIQIQYWIVPGIAFDKNGYRLGFGKGYYDAFLKDATGLKIGVGYDWQYIDQLPCDAHDIAMDVLIIEDKVLMIQTKEINF